MNSSSKLPDSDGNDQAEHLSPWQAEKLSRWRELWELHWLLATKNHDDADETSSECHELDRAVLPEGLIAPYETDPQTLKQGAIRLLAEELTNGHRPHVNVLVLGPWGGKESQSWLIAPYGPFSEPADESELKTGRDEPGLRVLCVWNARIVPSEVLLISWLLGEAEPDEVADALAVFRCHTGGEPLPIRLRPLVGPPILSKSDPRITYFAEERGVLAGIDRRAALRRDSVTVVSTIVPDFVAELWKLSQQLQSLPEEAGRSMLVDWYLARVFVPTHLKRGLRGAGDRGEAVVEELCVGDNGARVRITEQQGQPGTFRARVLEDPKGEMEGARIISKEGVPLATFKDQRSNMEFSGSNGFLIQFSDGNLPPLNPKSWS